MSTGELQDDPFLHLELHASTIDLLYSLLSALEQRSEGTARLKRL